MRAIVPFKTWHYGWMADAAEGDTICIPPAGIALIEAAGSFTAVVDGEPVAYGGVVNVWPGRHQAHACMTKAAGPHMHWLTKFARDVVAKPKGRVEFTVLEGFELGHKWARLLGFEVETPCLKHFGPFGENHVGYLRIN